MKKLLFVLMVLCFLFSSCSNDIADNKSTLEIEQKPIINDIEEVEGLRVVSITNAEYYLYKMEPLWNYSKNDSPYGSTIGLESPVKPDGTSFGAEYKDFKLISASTNLGYFSQGKWALTIYALDKDYNKIIKDAIYKEIYLNSFSNKLSIDLDNQMFVSGNDCSIKIDNFSFELTAAESMYGKEEKDGYKLSVTLYKVNDGAAYSLSTIGDPIDIPVLSENKTNIEFVSKSGASDDPKVYGVIKDFFIAENLNNGSYVVSIKLYEHNGTKYEDAGGITFSFVATNGFVSVIESDGSKVIDLKAADYVPIKGDGSIIIDSGVKTEVTVKAYDSSNKEITTTTAGQTISVKAVVKEIIDKNTSNTIRVDNYKWFVDGAEVTDKVNSSVGITLTKPVINLSDGSLLFYSTSVKTYTITYMFLDGTNYNTISGNCYLTVNAATTSTP